MCGARGDAGDGEANAGHDARRARRAPLARSDREGRRRVSSTPSRTAARASVAATPKPTSAGQVLAAAAQAALLAAADPERRQPGARAQPERARAPWAVQLVRGERDAVRAERARAQAPEAEGLHRVDVQMWALAVARGPQQPGDVGDRLSRAELVVHQHHRDHGGVGADGGRHRLGADDAVRGGRHHVQGPALAGQRLGAAHDRRVLERAHDEVPAARRARRAQDAQRVGLGAAAREQQLGGLDVQRRRHLRARAVQSARAAAAPGVRRGRVGVELRGGGAQCVQHLRGRLRRGGVVQIDHERATIGGTVLGRRGSLR